MRRHFKIRPWFLCAVLALAVSVLLVNRYVLGVFRVSGTSMTPTLQNGEWCLVWKLGAQHPKRGDIIFLRTTDDPPVFFVKRVVALPGEMISIEDGKMFINEAPVEESYSKANTTWGLKPTRVPHDFYYFMGDHRAVVIENHLQGMVASRNIQGRIIAHWNPPLDLPK